MSRDRRATYDDVSFLHARIDGLRGDVRRLELDIAQLQAALLGLSEKPKRNRSKRTQPTRSTAASTISKARRPAVSEKE